jgi:hypothetical protein
MVYCAHCTGLYYRFSGKGSSLLKNNYFTGLYYRFSGDRQRTTKEYLMADGQMSVLPVAFSLMASFMSAITLLGVTQVSSHPSIKHHPAEVSLVLDN